MGSTESTFREKYLDKTFDKDAMADTTLFNIDEIEQGLKYIHPYFSIYSARASLNLIIDCAKLVYTYNKLESLTIFEERRGDRGPRIHVMIRHKNNNKYVFKYFIDNTNNKFLLVDNIKYVLDVNNEQSFVFNNWSEIEELFKKIIK